MEDLVQTLHTIASNMRSREAFGHSESDKVREAANLIASLRESNEELRSTLKSVVQANDSFNI